MKKVWKNTCATCMLPITTTRIYRMVRVIIGLFSFFHPFFFKHQALKLPNKSLLDTE